SEGEGRALLLRFVDREVARAAVAPDEHEDLGALDLLAQLHRLVGIRDRFLVELPDDIALLQALFGRGRVRFHAGDQRALYAGRQLKLIPHLIRDVADADAIEHADLLVGGSGFVL